MSNFDTKDEVERKMKGLPIIIWILILVLGFAISIKILFKLAGIELP